MEANINTQDVVSKKPSLFGMITSPGEQFERMKTSNAVWGAFWLLVLIAGLVGGFAAYVYSLTPEAIKLNKELGVTVSAAMTYGMGFGVIAISMAFVFLLSAVVYKVLMVFISNDTSYKKLLAITVYSSVISLLGLLINTILAYILGGTGQEMYTGLEPIFASSSDVVKGIVSKFEVFTIWGYAVTWLGLQITAGLTKKQATIITIVFFVLTLGMGALQGMFQ
ncbi:Yip1 family protein [Bacillus thuringiensis]|uniref:Yip1 family protein n=1 Tax=Bacillus thuringiensis TaxID=1428 RepID=UPI000A3A0FAF|nr:Yip1 family protein [Bacillus thuringiensis]MED2128760.1 Yip1 family protein [Bacillus thuringiensis]MED2149857.1 Yip1 family protein [Bacillus thuringiensis]MED2175708.1 Yip1 family protein [Bacillus thuringiensis]MED2477668.1 Yip1 family protein [Bacillus thuringiensis]MED2575695.1 Yip1 family protein [Bacillus thuringiensis]